MEIRKRRIYDPPTDRDGTRILVDDLWPRGISKQQARLDGCWRTLAPGKGLRQWFAHDPSRWEGFKERLLFVIEHSRRRIVHFNVTPNPTSAWVIQQLREAFPFDTAPRHLIFDRDTIFSPAVVRFVKAMGTSLPNGLSLSMAKSRGRTLDRQLPTRAPRACCCPRRAPSGPTATFLPRVLSRGSGSSRVSQGRTGPAIGHAATFAHGQGRRIAPRRWTSSPLRWREAA